MQRRLGSVVVAKDLVELQPPLLPSASARSRSYDGSMAHSSSVDNCTSACRPQTARSRRHRRPGPCAPPPRPAPPPRSSPRNMLCSALSVDREAGEAHGLAGGVRNARLGEVPEFLLLPRSLKTAFQRWITPYSRSITASAVEPILPLSSSILVPSSSHRPRVDVHSPASPPSPSSASFLPPLPYMYCRAPARRGLSLRRRLPSHCPCLRAGVSEAEGVEGGGACCTAGVLLEAEWAQTLPSSPLLCPPS